MIHELMQMCSAAGQDLLAQEQMQLLQFYGGDEQEFFDKVCEVAAEHLDPPEDMSIRSFDMLVGAIIAGFISAKTLQREIDAGRIKRDE